MMQQLKRNFVQMDTSLWIIVKMDIVKVEQV